LLFQGGGQHAKSLIAERIRAKLVQDGTERGFVKQFFNVRDRSAVAFNNGLVGASVVCLS